MSDVPFLENLATNEPWRQGVGTPSNALDPAWSPGPTDAQCDGDVDWEPGTHWWFCKKCGRVSSLNFLRHKPVQSPFVFLLEAISFFQSKRQALAPKTVMEQMAFVAGTALRYAAVHADLGGYASRMVTK